MTEKIELCCAGAGGEKDNRIYCSGHMVFSEKKGGEAKATCSECGCEITFHELSRKEFEHVVVREQVYCDGRGSLVF